MNLNLHDILYQPLITERSTDLREGLNKVVFIVSPYANKHQIKLAVERTLKVKVGKVNIVNVEGKKKKLGKFEGKKPNRKKAIVTLKKGEKLDIFEGG
ncbi:MAG TPA: 50S ribosomal protein L23 [Nitrospirota bacterium]|nr:50S ribosomal protein L23 [Nitrospirota bacterium]HKZ71615.1 50S ribosomal protein L23 [Nitrospirota bacterium]